jgi:hypothetical protein
LVSEPTSANSKSGCCQSGLESQRYAYAKAGRRTDAERMLAKLKNRDGDAKPYLIASVYMGMGHRDATFRYLKEAASGIDDMAADLPMDPVFDLVRDDPRMAGILVKLKLPQKN